MRRAPPVAIAPALAKVRFARAARTTLGGMKYGLNMGAIGGHGTHVHVAC